MSDDRTSPRLAGYRDAMAERAADPGKAGPAGQGKYMAGYQAGAAARAEEVRRDSAGLRLAWVPVERPPGGLLGWQAGGADENYLVANGSFGAVLLCRWARGQHNMDDLVQACRTLIHVPSMNEGRRLAQQYEAGLDVEGESEWCHGYQPGLTVTSDTGPFVTKTGRVLTEADLDALADEAEAGYEQCPQCGRLVPDLGDPRGHKMDCTAPSELPPIPGHDGPGHTPDGPADCPRCALLREHGTALEDAAARVEAELSGKAGQRAALRQRQDAERATMATRHAAERAGFESAASALSAWADDGPDVTPFRPDLLP
jgi:hypothetical protein